MDWPRLLAYITGTVDQELLLRNEYLAAENRILKAQIKGRLLLSDAERITLAEIGHRLGRESLEDVAVSAKPDTILGWYRKLIANKFDGSKSRRTHGRPRVDEEMEYLVVKMVHAYPVVSARHYILWFRSFAPICVASPVGSQARIVGTCKLSGHWQGPRSSWHTFSGGKVKPEVARLLGNGVRAMRLSPLLAVS